MQDLADATTVTKAAIYYYYASKEAILLDILAFADSEVISLLNEAMESSATPLVRVGGLVESHVTWYLKHPDIARVAFRDWSALTGEALATQVERRRRYSRIMRDAIEECKSTGLLSRGMNTLLVANFINGAVATSNVWFDPSGPHSPEQVGASFGEMAMAVVAGKLPMELVIPRAPAKPTRARRPAVRSSVRNMEVADEAE